MPDLAVKETKAQKAERLKREKNPWDAIEAGGFGNKEPAIPYVPETGNQPTV